MNSNRSPDRLGRDAVYASAILTLAYLLAFADRTVIGLLAIPIEHQFQIGDLQLALLQGSAFAVFYAAFGLPISWALDRYDRRRIVALGVLLWSAMTCLGGLSHTFSGLFAARVFVGIGEATILPGATSLIADLVPATRRGRVLGVFSAGIYAGSALALIGGGWVLHAMGGVALRVPVLGALDPWRVVMLLAGLPGLLVGSLAFRMVEPPRRHVTAPASAPPNSAGGARRAGLTWLFAGFTALAFANYAISAWLPTLLARRFAWPLGRIGLVLGVIALLVGPLGSMVAGGLADRVEQRGRSGGRVSVALGAALGLAVAAISLGASRGVTGELIAITGFVFFGSFSWGLAAGAIQDSVDSRVVARVTAVYTALLNLIALSAGPASVPLLMSALRLPADAIGTAIAIVVPAACVVAALALRAFQRARHAPSPAPVWPAAPRHNNDKETVR